MSYRKLETTIRVAEGVLAGNGAPATVIDTQIDHVYVYLALKLNGGTRPDQIEALGPRLGEAFGNRNTTVHMAHPDSRAHHDIEIWISREVAR